MTDQTELTPALMDAVKLTPPPNSSTPEPATKPISAPKSAVEYSETPAEPTADTPSNAGRWFGLICGLVALLAAIVALTAPALRPAIADAADTVLGKGNIVAWLVAPSTDASWRTARDEALQVVTSRMAEYSARLDRLAATQQATTADVARAAATTSSADRSSNEALTHAVEDLTRQTKELRAATTALDMRTRAAGLLTLSLRLRRDVDAGLSIDRDRTALLATGPYPGPIEHALQQLRQYGDGVPTMRDLGDAFDLLLARMIARSDAGSSWTDRSWSRLSGMFSNAPPTGDSALFDHLRALANEGRFSEAAEAVAGSSYADLGRDWIAQVRARATAVVATQALLSYALTAYEDAYSAQAADVGGKPTQ